MEYKPSRAEHGGIIAVKECLELAEAGLEFYIDIDKRGDSRIIQSHLIIKSLTKTLVA